MAQEKKDNVANYQDLIDQIKAISSDNVVTHLGDISDKLGDGWNEGKLLKKIRRIERQAKNKAEADNKDYEMVFPKLEEAIAETERRLARKQKRQYTVARHTKEARQKNAKDTISLELLFQRQGYPIYRVLNNWEILKHTFPLVTRDQKNFDYDRFAHLQQAARDEQTTSITERGSLIQYILDYPNRIAYICSNSDDIPKDRFFNSLLDMILKHKELIDQKNSGEMEILIGLFLQSYGPEYAWEFFREIYQCLGASGRKPFTRINHRFRHAIITQVTANNMSLSDEKILILISNGFVLIPSATKKQVSNARQEIKRQIDTYGIANLEVAMER